MEALRSFAPRVEDWKRLPATVKLCYMATSDDRRPTLQEIADKAQVSLMTVSYSFNNPGRVAEATRQRVLTAATELGYQGKNPWATALRVGKAGALGVVFSEHLTYAFTDPQATDFLTGVASVCAEDGLGLTFIPTIGDPEDAKRVGAAPVDGYVFWTTSTDDPCLEAAVNTHRPCAIQGGPAHDGFARISVPDRTAATGIARVGLRYPISHPVIVSFSLDVTRTPRAGYGIPLSEALLPVTHARLAGFQDALAEAGHDWNDAFILATARNNRQEAEQCFSRMLNEGTPVDLVLCTSDELALGVLDALELHGLRVPTDVIVTGWDDGPEAINSDLTTVHQSLFEQGRQCGLIAAGREVPVSSDESWHIVHRGTTHVNPQ